jgi:SAM-dependent methyltransferase
MATESYNERLFGGRDLRSYLHSARFHWVADVIRRHRLPTRRVFELGCFDGKLLDFLPEKPDFYLGADANWEKGLELGRQRYAGNPRVRLVEAVKPEDIPFDGSRFDLGVSMETLEHVPPGMVGDYLKKMAELVRGHVLLTVPNEIGGVFALKWLTKRLTFRDAEDYSLREFINQSLGRTWLVERNDHKGFDYRPVLMLAAQYFDVLAVESIPFRKAPMALAFGVGVLCRTR